jgi:hypothetical protein
MDVRQAQTLASSESERGQVPTTAAGAATTLDSSKATVPAAKATAAAATTTSTAQPPVYGQASTMPASSDHAARPATPPLANTVNGASGAETPTPAAGTAAAAVAATTTGEPLDRTVSVDYAVPLATMFGAGVANSAGQGASDSAAAPPASHVSSQNTHS